MEGRYRSFSCATQNTLYLAVHRVHKLRFDSYSLALVFRQDLIAGVQKLFGLVAGRRA
jgi:hypothetical protein